MTHPHHSKPSPLLLFILLTLSSCAPACTPSLLHAEEKIMDSNCEEPTWRSPAESHDGIFHGDLEMKCIATLGLMPPSFMDLKTAIEAQIQKESVIHSGPSPVQIYQLTGQAWDVSHFIREESSPITIREQAELATDQKSLLIYQTHSKEVIAQGMAGYLKAVDFSVHIQKIQDGKVSLIFRNQVTVKRPWFALDLLFAPIARKTCFQKMNQIKEKLFPWILGFLSKNAGATPLRKD